MAVRALEAVMGARSELLYEPLERRLRAFADGLAVVDSARPLLVWEPRRIVPSYAVPESDISAPLSPATAAEDAGVPVLHPGVPFAVHTAVGEAVSVGDRDGAGFRLGDAQLAGHVVLDFRAFDEWREEDDVVVGHPRDPFHRVDVRVASRPVRVELNGEILAESSSARLLSETALPVRFYFPREDVRLALLPHEQRSYCAYKGEASYWSVDAGGRRFEKIGWSYEDPLPDGPLVRGMVAFWNEVVDIYVDGEAWPRPAGPIAQSLREEFGV